MTDAGNWCVLRERLLIILPWVQNMSRAASQPGGISDSQKRHTKTDIILV